VCHVFVGHLEALVEEPADDAARGTAYEHTSDQGQPACGDRCDEAPAVGVLTWDFETKAVEAKLKELGGTPQTHEVATLTAEVA
jgi:hypothetical protein